MLIRGDRLARLLRLDKMLRMKVFPIAVVALRGGHRAGGAAAVPAAREDPHPPDATRRLDHDPARADDEKYVEGKYREVEDSIQAGMDALARKRSLPLFG